MVPKTESREPPETEESRKSSLISVMTVKVKAETNSRLKIPGISLIVDTQSVVTQLSSLFLFPSLFSPSHILCLQEP